MNRNLSFLRFILIAKSYLNNKVWSNQKIQGRINDAN